MLPPAVRNDAIPPTADSLAFPQLAGCQGPSLLVHNDAVFTEKDFASIRRIGDSLKRAEVGKTGRYGLGFNSVYHLTDIPMFVSDSYLCIFQPSSAANPGRRIDFNAARLLSLHPDTCAPFQAFGCDMITPFAGTLFRFALRTEEVAAGSDISNQAYPPERMQQLFQDMEQECALLLLFLKNVETISMLEWRVGEAQVGSYCHQHACIVCLPSPMRDPSSSPD